MRITLIKKEKGLRTVLVEPGRRSGLPAVALRNLARADLVGDVAKVVADIESARLAAKAPVSV